MGGSVCGRSAYFQSKPVIEHSRDRAAKNAYSNHIMGIAVTNKKLLHRHPNFCGVSAELPDNAVGRGLIIML